MLLKKIGSFALLGIFIMSPLQNAMASKQNFKDERIEVFAPNSPASNEFTVGPVFLRSSGSNDYAVLVSPFNPSAAAPILSPSWETKGFTPSLSAGVLLNFRHNFANTTSDINFNWTHLNASDDANFTPTRTPPPQFGGPIWNIGPNAGTTSNPVTAQLKNNYDVFHAEFGKHLNLDPKLKTRLFTGLSGLWLEQKKTVNFSGLDPILNAYTFNITTDSKYHAAGLRLGVDGEYRAVNNFDIVGMFAGNLYMGNLQPSTTTSGTGTVLANSGIPVNYQSLSHNSYLEAIPSVEAKLGLKYSYDFLDGKTFSIEAGYMASVYSNVIQDYVPSTLAPLTLGIVTGSIFLQSLIKSTHSFAVDGPYLTFSAKI